MPKGYLYAVATDDYRPTADSTLATHGLNAVQFDFYIVPQDSLDGTADIIALPPDTYLPVLI